MVTTPDSLDACNACKTLMSDYHYVNIHVQSPRTCKALSTTHNGLHAMPIPTPAGAAVPM